MRYALYRLILDALHFSGAGAAAAPFLSGMGVIFTLHRVTDEPAPDFDPNGILNVRPQFLKETLETCRRMKLDIISPDEVAARIRGEKSGKPFVCFTLDDGYADTFHEAYPLFKAFDAPFTVYVASGFLNGTMSLWWLALQHIIAEKQAIFPENAEFPETLPAGSSAEKAETFQKLWSWLLFRATHQEREAFISCLADAADYDLKALCTSLAMTWEEARTLAADPLATIGGHTVSHPNVRTLKPDEARSEILGGLDDIEKNTGIRPAHFSYPYGMPGAAGAEEFSMAEDLGFKTAVTTRPGVIHQAHGNHLHALPRMSLNGEFQEQRYVRLLRSGLPALIANRGRALNVN